uniref:Metallophosphoesterase n=1 Tax=Rubinisphaera brasiliensis (strain ATCC 49424 / DSM 5305 / JCM 21570 / IAM 15109 / NBRC 103401 / IFAM 1448) TaxID=756272 RepID=F0SIF2_RUBBR|nr:metallophosphoesterase [Rubinisphaera brasiliensis DSM 5305]
MLLTLPSGPNLPSRCHCFIALVIPIIAILSLSQVVEGHEPDGPVQTQNEQANHEHPTRGLLLPSLEGPRPWSAAPALTGDDRFHFAVVSDRTGGHRPGIWLKAAQRLNWLRPEFVVSVGDLIEGYTADRSAIEAQWQEFLGLVAALEMKFFFVPGNHDVTNPLMQKIWREHFGRAWYSFDYKDVHFICLSSEDPETHIGLGQLEWLADDLAKHSDARWTMMFMHKPLWVHTEAAEAVGSPDPTNWSRVRELLGDRPVTVFTGHTHQYLQYRRGNNEYFNLATTGGGSKLRGEKYGEFDHVTWVTMEPDGPRVVNLTLDGILPGDVVTEELGTQFANFLKNTDLQVAPLIVDDTHVRVGRLQFRTRNEHSTPVTFEVDVHGLPLSGIVFDEADLKWTAEPGQSQELDVEFRLSEAVEISRLKQVFVTATATSHEEVPLQSETKMPLFIGDALKIARASRKIDGDLNDWEEWPWDIAVSEREPIQFNAVYDDTNVYFGIDVIDRQLTDMDQLEIVLDARDLEERLTNPTLSLGSTVITISAPDADGRVKIESTGGAVITAQASRRTEDGFQVEWSMPVSPIYQLQGRNWQGFQAGLRYQDDDSKPKNPVMRNWHAGPGFKQDNRDLIHIFREE